MYNLFSSCDRLTSMKYKEKDRKHNRNYITIAMTIMFIILLCGFLSILEGRLRFKNEGLKDDENPPKLLMIQCLNLEQPMEQIGRERFQEEARTEPTVGRPCIYRPRSYRSKLSICPETETDWEVSLCLRMVNYQLLTMKELGHHARVSTYEKRNGKYAKRHN
ncbi:hypothetical protein M9H77_36452 [Catharanthus roseus]|uniref:Uncharacterized protein n=1 Tax=Catharanthus roseus TaxID=4058 RepID=A0ACB9ZW41_CATRO|nr:hypothetical protein M9H77_36452 [Catharanthus roseus]